MCEVDGFSKSDDINFAYVILLHVMKLVAHYSVMNIVLVCVPFRSLMIFAIFVHTEYFKYCRFLVRLKMILSTMIMTRTQWIIRQVREPALYSSPNLNHKCNMGVEWKHCLMLEDMERIQQKQNFGRSLPVSLSYNMNMEWDPVWRMIWFIFLLSPTLKCLL